MREYYHIEIQETGLTESLADEEGGYNFRLFNVEKKDFPTLEEAKKWIADRYKDVKLERGDEESRPIYVDKKDGTTQQVGLSYTYKNKDISHDSDEWTQCDWVQVFKVQEEVADFWSDEESK